MRTHRNLPSDRIRSDGTSHAKETTYERGENTKQQENHPVTPCKENKSETGQRTQMHRKWRRARLKGDFWRENGDLRTSREESKKGASRMIVSLCNTIRTITERENKE
jgi:hypothetical protein